MKSKTKIKLTNDDIRKIFKNADLGIVKCSKELGDGEYNAVYEVQTEMGDFVLKVAPYDSTNILTYERDLMRSEVYWYAKMRTNTNINTPQVYYKDFSHKIFPSDYFIMEKVKGVPLNKLTLKKEDKIHIKKELAKITANLHSATNDSFGYIQNELYADWYCAFKSMVQNLIEDCKRVNKNTNNGEKLLSYIETYKNLLKNVSCSLVNFDMWDANVIYDNTNGKVNITLIDLERSFWGDPIFDFGCLEMMSFSLDKKTTTIKAYNDFAKTQISCTNEEQIRYAFSLGYLGLIQEAEKYYRYTLKSFGWHRNVVMSKVLYKNAFSVLENGKK